MLECLLALSLLGAAVLAVSPLLIDVTRAPQRTAVADETLMRVDQLMMAISLWPRRDLELRLGARRQGPFLVHIQRVTSEVYEVSIGTSRVSTPLLTTRLLRLRAGEEQ